MDRYGDRVAAVAARPQWEGECNFGIVVSSKAISADLLVRAGGNPAENSSRFTEVTDSSLTISLAF